MSFNQQHFHWADYLVLLAMLVFSAGIGIYFRFTGGKQKTTEEYLLGDRNQKVLPVAISLMASFLSAIAILGTSAEMYMFGTQYLIVNLSYIVCTPIACYLFIPVFFKLQATSAYEYLERRFGRTTRTAASFMYSFQVMVYTGVILYTPAMTLQVLTGLSVELAILLVGLVCVFYSTIGGIKAVIVTDVFQALLMFAAVFCVIVSGIKAKGSVGNIWRIAEERGRIEFFNFTPDLTVRHTFWSLMCGGGLTFLSQFAVNQTQVQRYMTMKDVDSAKRALWISTPIVVVFYAITGFAGLSIFAAYSDCDPITSGRIKIRDELVPLFVVESLGEYPGLAGLFIAGIFSAALSSVSATTNSLAAVTVEDYIKPLYMWLHEKPFPEGRTTILSKMLAMTYGIICVLLGFLARFVDGILQAAISIIGVVGGPLLGTFTLGMFIPAANEPGVLAGMVAGVLCSLWVSLQEHPPPHHLPLSTAGCPANTSLPLTSHALLSDDNSDHTFWNNLSYMWFIVTGFLVTTVLGSLVSCITSCCHTPNRTLDPDLFSAPVAALLRSRLPPHHDRRVKHQEISHPLEEKLPTELSCE
ncbi:putative sodium-dependent multivitamin transporter [Homalodisca vitripennis]|uniref:putative sodium-dependent multivitamin transporter n=1 Tax=Homalodisca vitripennis TaxID=197043 RepID=UPI001EEC531B|nr:putative sodium-dependent multivitamin transporter [Homalodisca vitripennis]XP_046668279.1 putative sodium-dependent multivitamin transporter [Homalodisca vitripennis]XP_046668280.1 putative sodium-dependent multivitamin transporter [Homalodisca vitripennis]KAG8266488.1 hypothetical protein J6590_070866 [Homalodisca vitripennis]